MQGGTTTVRSINAANKPVSLGEVFFIEPRTLEKDASVTRTSKEQMMA